VAEEKLQRSEAYLAQAEKRHTIRASLICYPPSVVRSPRAKRAESLFHPYVDMSCLSGRWMGACASARRMGLTLFRGERPGLTTSNSSGLFAAR
jgi:hypothetical protein